MSKRSREYVEATQVFMMRRRPTDSRLAVVDVAEASQDGRRVKQSQIRMAAPSAPKNKLVDLDLLWRADPLEIELPSEPETDTTGMESPIPEVHKHNLSTAKGQRTFATLVRLTVARLALYSLMRLVRLTIRFFWTGHFNATTFSTSSSAWMAVAVSLRTLAHRAPSRPAMSRSIGARIASAERSSARTAASRHMRTYRFTMSGYVCLSHRRDRTDAARAEMDGAIFRERHAAIYGPGTSARPFPGRAVRGARRRTSKLCRDTHQWFPSGNRTILPVRPSADGGNTRPTVAPI